MVDENLCRLELEALTGKIYRGDSTPLIYSLFKNTPYKEAMLLYLDKGKEKKNDEEIKVNLKDRSTAFSNFFENSTIIE